MKLTILLIIQFLLVIIPVALNKGNDDILIRKKRYLIFPEGASITVSLNFMITKIIVSEISDLLYNRKNIF